MFFGTVVRTVKIQHKFPSGQIGSSLAFARWRGGSHFLPTVSSAVLWRQVGGRQWQLLMYRRRCSMLARGLLTGATLDNR